MTNWPLPPGNCMDKAALLRRLETLATQNDKRSKAALLRDVLDGIELALAAGVRRVHILEELKAHGLEMTPSTFDRTLNRLRARRTTAAVQTAPASTSVATTPVPAKAAHASAADPEPTGVADPDPLVSIFRSNPDLNKLAKQAPSRSKK